MKHVVTLIIGIAIGMYLHAQNAAVHMPVFHLPNNIKIDNGLLFAIAVLIAALFLRSKITGGRTRRGVRK